MGGSKDEESGGDLGSPARGFESQKAPHGESVHQLGGGDME